MTEASQERHVPAFESCNLFNLFGRRVAICSAFLKQMQNNKSIMSQEWLTYVGSGTVKFPSKHKLILNIR